MKNKVGPNQHAPTQAGRRRLAITAIIFLVSIGVVGQFYLSVSPSLSDAPSAALELSGTWDLCLSDSASAIGCAWSRVQVPSDLSAPLQKTLQGWLIYKKRFTAPKSCLAPGSDCSIVLGEVGDAVEAHLNGVSIGRRGEFPPQARYSKHYPAHFDLSRDLLRTGDNANELVFTVYSMKKMQAGIRRGPVAVFNGTEGVRATQSFVVATVLVPLMGFVGLFLIAVIATLVSLIQQDEDPKLHSYIRYCFAAAMFLLSFSEIPREYLPIWIAGYLHFTIRVISDWAYFEMMREYFDFGPWTRFVRPFYWASIGAFAISFIHDYSTGYIVLHPGAGFDIAYKIMGASVPLLLLPHILGMIGSYKLRNKIEGKALFGFFTLLLVFQIRDSAIFHGYLSGGYAVKFYPFLLAIFMGALFLDRSRETHARRIAEREDSRQMKQIHDTILELAHQINSPVSGFVMAHDRLKKDPHNPKILLAVAKSLPAQADRLIKLNKSILDFSKEMATGVRVEKSKTDLRELIRKISNELCLAAETAGATITIDEPSSAVSIDIDPDQMHRVFSNLMVNAIEACAGTAGGHVRATIKSPTLIHPWTEVTITDNGPGIAAEIKDKLFLSFATHGKSNGNGLGLAISKRVVQAHGGTISLEESAIGATFRVVLPA